MMMVVVRKCGCCDGVGEIRNGGDGPLIECPVCMGRGEEEIEVP